jgi:acyl carrier protein
MNKEETLLQLRNIVKPYINNEEAFENFTGRHRFHHGFEYQFG